MAALGGGMFLMSEVPLYTSNHMGRARNLALVESRGELEGAVWARKPVETRHVRCLEILAYL